MSKKVTRSETENPRFLSLSELAALLNRDRNTVMKWVNKDGCPVVQKANRDIGQAWILDVAEVVAWLEDRAAKSIASKFESDDTDISYDEAKRREKVAAAVMAELELDEVRREVVRVSDVIDEVSKEYAALRSSLQTVGGMVAPRLIGLNAPAQIQSVIDEAVVDVLEALTYDRNSRHRKRPESASPVSGSEE